MRLKWRSAAGVFSGIVATGFFTPAAHAQMAVYDGASYAELVTQEASLAAQVTSLQNSLQAQLDMIRSTQTDIFAPVGGLANATLDLENSILNLKDFGASLQAQLDSEDPLVFPSGNPQEMLDQIAAETADTRQAIAVSQEIQNQVTSNQAQLWAQVQRAEAASQSASGPLAAQQETNQILAGEVQQLGDLQGILVSSQRAEQRAELQDQSQSAATSQYNAPLDKMATPEGF